MKLTVYWMDWIPGKSKLKRTLNSQNLLKGRAVGVRGSDENAQQDQLFKLAKANLIHIGSALGSSGELERPVSIRCGDPRRDTGSDQDDFYYVYE